MANKRNQGVSQLKPAHTYTYTYTYTYTHGIGLLALTLIFLYTQILLTPHHQLFRLNDTHIQHPHADPETVPVWQLILYAAILPLTLTTIISLIHPRPAPASKRLYTTYLTIQPLIITLLLTNVLTKWRF